MGINLAAIAIELGPIVIWICISVVFSLQQIWMGALRCRRRTNPPMAWQECINASLADGNLFIFSISTSGGVLAVALTEIYRQQGGLFLYLGVSVFLILASVVIIVFAAHEWTDAKSATGLHLGQKVQSTLQQMSGADVSLRARDIAVSIYAASASFICAFVAEVLR